MLSAANYNRNSSRIHKTLDGAGADAKDPGDFFRGKQGRHSYGLSGVGDFMLTDELAYCFW
jgi:hypothetical protein